MATNMFKKYTESKTREVPVPAGTQSGDIVESALGIGVALTDRGDGTRPAGIPGVTGGTVPNGGVGNKDGSTVLAFDGTWLFDVTGVTDGDTTTTGEIGDEVTLESDGSLELGGSGTAVGVIDDGVVVDGRAPVRIGGAA